MVEPLAIDLSAPRRIHVVGVGGSGMSAIAEILLAMGHRVSGSDLSTSAVTERLARLGVEILSGHDRANVGGAEAVTISTAVPPDNPEVVAARERGVPVLSRAQVLAAMCRRRRTMAISGSHGKTTTAAMLATILTVAGRRPSFVVGGTLNGIGTGARWDNGAWFVVEADESDGTFLQLPAEVAVVTSVEPDHLEYWGGFRPLVDAFDRFLEGASVRIVCADDPKAAELAAGLRRPNAAAGLRGPNAAAGLRPNAAAGLRGPNAAAGLRGPNAVAAPHAAATYGFAATADHRIVGYEGGRDGCRFAVEHRGRRVDVVLSVPGRHNAANATAAIVAAADAGVAAPQAAAALARYRGVARRAQKRGEREGVVFVEEYAHLPGEVSAALSAAKEGDWRRIVCVFQPHRYSRTAALWRDFGTAFGGADLLAVTDVYPAGEAPRLGVTGKLVVDAVLDASPGRRVGWFPDRPGLVDFLRRELRPGDLCLTLAAGDLTTLPGELLGQPPASGGAA